MTATRLGNVGPTPRTHIQEELSLLKFRVVSEICVEARVKRRV